MSIETTFDMFIKIEWYGPFAANLTYDVHFDQTSHTNNPYVRCLDVHMTMLKSKDEL